MPEATQPTLTIVPRTDGEKVHQKFVPEIDLTKGVNSCVYLLADILRQELIFSRGESSGTAKIYLQGKLNQAVEDHCIRHFSNCSFDALFRHKNIMKDIAYGHPSLRKTFENAIPVIRDEVNLNYDEQLHRNAVNKKTKEYIVAAIGAGILSRVAEIPEISWPEMVTDLQSDQQITLATARSDLVTALSHQLQYCGNDKLQAIGEANAYVMTLEKMIQTKFESIPIAPVRAIAVSL